MKRDMDLIREILLGIEAAQVKPGAFLGFRGDKPIISGYDPADCLYNLRLAIDEGLVESNQDHGGLLVGVTGLTWKGHDFLDQVRDPEIWRITKEGAKEAGGFSFDLLAALAKGFLKKKIEEHTGVTLDL